ncbi:MAG TPA: alanine--tRNA ligase [Rhodospirillaceae bacterium]|nr:alanine--tRNA ligase [Rhodospirillaceae bacterium]
MKPNELRDSYYNFMRSKGSVIIPSAGLLPENDPTTLFTGAGMQPMIPYLLGEKHPSGNDISNTQKCLRTGDIDETGDNSHLTFFEMIGRWELGGDPSEYKGKQIRYMWEWQVDILGIDPKNLYVSVYQGNKDMGIPQDDDAIAVWTELFKSVGIDPKVEDEPWTYGASRGGRIFLYDEKENWWSRAGVPENMPVGEPGGPDSEMFYDFEPNGDAKDHPATDSARFLEIGNNVFMAFMRKDTGFELLDKPNIDYGGGLERICAALNGNPDLYLTPFFDNTREKLAEISGKSYEGNERNFRIILDHTRAATFLIGDGAPPSNVDAGYITRRLMRRAIRVARKLDINESFMTKLAEIYIAEAAAYPELEQNKAMILDVIAKEEEQFQKTIQNGEREMQRHLEKSGSVTGRDAFYFYETFGFPLELTEEFLKEHGEKLLQPEEFEKAAKEHADKSRTAAAGKFAGGLADHSEKTTAFHTATHLMLAGLQQVLGTHVHQKGSNITGERARFDFSHGEKMTPEEKQAVEDFVNKAIEANAEMRVVEMPKQQAMDEGVEGSFWEKYPDIVKVYIFEDANGKVWSKELCGGPHVENTGKIGEFGLFKIKKEESSSAGVRRIKAVLKEA